MAAKTALPMYAEEVERNVQTRLARIEGQVRGVARMIDAQRPCVEVLSQLASIEAALRGVSKAVLRNYLERCATDAIRSGNPAIYDELVRTLYRFMK
jgi:DNA-binding FrmR family transcriptional regulator